MVAKRIIASTEPIYIRIVASTEPYISVYTTNDDFLTFLAIRLVDSSLSVSCRAPYELSSPHPVIIPSFCIHIM